MLKHVHLFQPNYSMGGTGSLQSNWIPYSAGCIWAYAQTDATIVNNYKLIELHYKRENIDELLNRLEEPAVCGFSTYSWNQNYNATVSKRIKAKWPNCKIIFGGPGVDENSFNFFLNHPWVDSIINGEGEIAFKDCLLDILSNTLKKQYVGNRIQNLDLPSPYTTGVFDSMLANESCKWAATLETNRGCPFECTFCDWGSATQSKIKKFHLEKVFAELEWFSDNQIDYLYIADANFTVFAERDMEIAKKLVECKMRTGFPKTMNTNYNKNNSIKVLDTVRLLEGAGLSRGITLSVQSNSDKVLTAVKRKNMEISKLSEIYKTCNAQNISYYTEFILGMPEESKESWRDGLCTAIDVGCHGAIDAYFLSLLPNSELAQHVDKYKMVVKSFAAIHASDVSQIPEYTNLIIATNTLTTDDWVDCWLYSWMIINFHSYGWTQLVAQYVHKRYKLSYREIYDSLFEFLQEDELFNKQYTIEKDRLNFFATLDNSTADLEKTWLELTKPSRGNITLHLDRDKTFKSLDIWFKRILKDDSLTAEVIRYQHWYTVNKNNANGTIEMFNFDIFDYLLNDSEINSTPVTYHIQPSENWGDDDNFIDYVIFRARTGFPKHRFTRIETK